MAIATANTQLDQAFDTFGAHPFISRLAQGDIALGHRVSSAALDLEADTRFALSRQQVLSYLVKLNRALDQEVWDLASTILVKFCGTLTDYLSIGHEQVFRLSTPKSHQYVAIAATSRAVMRFSDQFARISVTEAVDYEGVQVALEQLALTLETRFELEDELQLGYAG
ncbi:MAG: Rsd/AlgQ family anti-sigma factor [Pseudomonadales bacterium]